MWGGHSKYLYRSLDKLGQAVDFLLTAHRDEAAAQRFFEHAIKLNGIPASLPIDKRDANRRR
jgi:putative transposase